MSAEGSPELSGPLVYVTAIMGAVRLIVLADHPKRQISSFLYDFFFFF